MNKTLVDVLRLHAQQQPDKVAFKYIDNNLKTTGERTYRQLHCRAGSIANHLKKKYRSGERLLLVFPHGLEFIDAFLACLYGGIIAVPVPPVTNKRPYWDRINKIIKNSDISGVFTVEKYAGHLISNLVDSHSRAFSEVTSIESVILSGDEKNEAFERVTNVAFLQYTSGSTGFPKAVAITHNSIMANQKLIQQNFNTSNSTIGCGWLPMFHDMGLIGNILHTIYLGSFIVLLSPMSFVAKPLLWLQVISRFRVTVCGGPNFAYDLCVNKITEQHRDTLDLSTWQVAFIGSEPVRPEVIKAFNNKFSQCRFDPNAFHPCYGLAEACLFVAGCLVKEPPVTMIFDRAQLQQQTSPLRALDPKNLKNNTSKTVQLVAAGQLDESNDVRIVDQNTGIECSEGVIGEIWVANQDVQNSYWKDSERSRETFNAFDNQGNGPFLRTGDLGFVLQSQLFVTSRLKDLVIIRGKNYAPQDIEESVQQCDKALQRDAGVAFSLPSENGDECLVIVQEVRRNYMRSTDLEDVIRNIRRAVLRDQEIDPAVVVLIRPASLPKTSSGKVQRKITKSRYVNNELLVIEQRTTQDMDEEHRSLSEADHRRESQWEEILLALWADVLNKPCTQISVFDSFFDVGGDSLMAQQIIGYLQNHHHIEIEPTEMYHSPTIHSLANLIEQKSGQSDNGNEKLIIGDI